MKELLKQYAAYNIWANKLLTDVVLQLPEEKKLAELPGSFKSLYLTVLHLWDAESIWWQRLKLQEKINVPSNSFKGSFEELVNELMQQSRQWSEWINNASDLSIEHVFQYQTFQGVFYKQPTWQMILHVFNHATYHRGQIINMLRQLGVEKIPATDFINWSRNKK
jgi:uncharacterized damage-inducible protein DinB